MTGAELIPGVDEYAAELAAAHQRAVLRTVAEWLLAIGYAVDWSTSVAPPTDLWEAVVDVVHMRLGAELSRDEVDTWLQAETAGPTKEA